jgi:uncharacterized protein DUF4124
MRRAALLALLFAFAPASQAIYKWVDEKGVTHYSESPPPDGKAEKIELRPSGPTPKTAAPAETWKERDLDSRRARIEKDREEGEAQAREKRAGAARKDNCNRARRELRILETQVPVYDFDDKNEKVYITDQDRLRDIGDLKQAIRENCDS